jgi:hypothetical protein
MTKSQKSRNRRFTWLYWGLGLVLSSSHLAAQPAAVRQAQAARWPQAEEVSYGREGCRCWEAEFQHGGHDLEALWTSDGTLVAINRKLARDQVPPAVQQAMGRRWPRVREAERMSRTSGQPLYELDLGGNRKRWFTEAGQEQRRPCPPKRVKRLP